VIPAGVIFTMNLVWEKDLHKWNWMPLVGYSECAVKGLIKRYIYLCFWNTIPFVHSFGALFLDIHGWTSTDPYHLQCDHVYLDVHSHLENEEGTEHF